MRFLTFLIGFLLLCSVSLPAQTSPQVYGLVKAQYEVSTVDGGNRFTVRNSRLGAKGAVSPLMRYNILMEVSSLGQFSILDAHIKFGLYEARDQSLEVVLGQQQMLFTTEVHRGASLNYFANRSFMGKFLGTYFGTAPNGDQILGNIGSRDVGAVVHYKCVGFGLPVSVSLGVFNGTTPANMGWKNWMNYNGRISVGILENLSVAASFYGGRSPLGDGMRIWGAEARYIKSRLIIESEFAQRHLDVLVGTDVSTAAVIHGMYIFPLACKLANSITPQLRWDWGDNMSFMNTQTNTRDSFSGQRLTAGVAIGTGNIWNKLLQSEIRFNYEYYMPDDRPSDFSSSKLLHNKFTVELFVVF